MAIENGGDLFFAVGDRRLTVSGNEMMDEGSVRFAPINDRLGVVDCLVNGKWFTFCAFLGDTRDLRDVLGLTVTWDEVDPESGPLGSE